MALELLLGSLGLIWVQWKSLMEFRQGSDISGSGMIYLSVSSPKASS